MGSDIRIGILVLVFIGILLIYLSRDSKSKRQEYLKTGVGCLGMIALIGFIIFTQRYDSNSLKEHKVKSIGKVVGFGQKKSIKWEFKTLIGETVEIVDKKRFQGLQVGEYYEIEYDSTDFKNARVILSKPIINFNPKDTIYEVSFPNGINNSNVYLTFKYEFENVIFERQQKIPRNENWKDVNDFIVVLNPNNPKIGYLIPKEN